MLIRCLLGVCLVLDDIDLGMFVYGMWESDIFE